MPSPTLGIAMSAINEDIHVAASVSQFYFAAEDIVIVDGGSKDRTEQIGQQLGARVLRRPFDFNYANQKNYALSQLQTDWIYVHELCERLEPTLLQILPKFLTPEGQQELVSEGILKPFVEPYDCFGFPRRLMVDGLQTKDYPDYQYRLFRNYCTFVKPAKEELVGFRNKTEVDFSSNSIDNPARFNILSYISQDRQEQQDELIKQIEGRQNAH